MLISREYLKEQRRMHQNERYGAASKKFAPQVASLIKARNPKSILDYGAGKCALRDALGKILVGRRFVEYDPGVKALSRSPARLFDLVCCIDVLEHIEPECLQDVLADIRRLTKRCAMLTIHTGPAGKTLSDGRNAHLIQEPLEWWHEKIAAHFDSVSAHHHNDTTIIAICEVSQ